MGQGMNSGIAQLRSASLRGSSAPLPAMWGFAHHRESPGTRVRKDSCRKERWGSSVGCSHSTGAGTPATGHPQSHGVGPITIRCFFPMCLIQPLSLFALEGPLALLPPRQSLMPCQITELRGSRRVSSCHLMSIWVPPGWLTAVCASWLALRRLTHSIAALPQRGACSKGMGP